MYVVVVKALGKKRYYVEEKNGVKCSETIGEWTPLFDEKMATKIAKKLAKKYHTFDEVVIEKVA